MHYITLHVDRHFKYEAQYQEQMRQHRIDSFRLYAMLLIIIGHTFAYGHLDFSAWFVRIPGYILALGVRFTVPFFFIVAGYFISRKISKEPEKIWLIASGYTLRLLIIFIFWSLVYGLERPEEFLQLLKEDPIRLVLEGTRIHLWFLVSLILTVWLYTLWPFRKNHESFLFLGVILFVIGLLAGAYKETPLGFDLHFDTRLGVFFSTLFFAIGVTFQTIKLPQLSWKNAAALAIGGAILYAFEAVCLKLLWSVDIAFVDYLVGSIPFGIGVFLFASTQPDTALDKFVGPYGRYMLGLYVVHFLFIDLYKPIGAWLNPYLWLLIYPMMVFATSLIACILIDKTPLRKLIM